MKNYFVKYPLKLEFVWRIHTKNKTTLYFQVVLFFNKYWKNEFLERNSFECNMYTYPLRTFEYPVLYGFLSWKSTWIIIHLKKITRNWFIVWSLLSITGNNLTLYFQTSKYVHLHPIWPISQCIFQRHLNNIVDKISMNHISPIKVSQLSIFRKNLQLSSFSTL